MQAWVKKGAQCNAIRSRHAAWRADETGMVIDGPPAGKVLTVCGIYTEGEMMWITLEELSPETMWDSRGFRPVVPEAQDLALFQTTPERELV